MNLITAAQNALTEMENVHREYLAGEHGGCPCTVESGEACPLETAISNLRYALEHQDAEA